MQLTKDAIKSYWETPDIRRHALSVNVSPVKLKELTELELKSVSKWGKDAKKLKGKNFYESLEYLSKKFIKEEGKALSETYTIVFLVPSIAKFCPRILTTILPPLFDLYSPGFKYDCKVIFDEVSTYADLVNIQEEVEALSKYNGNLNQVTFAYEPPELRGSQTGKFQF